MSAKEGINEDREVREYFMRREKLKLVLVGEEDQK